MRWLRPSRRDGVPAAPVPDAAPPLDTQRLLFGEPPPSPPRLPELAPLTPEIVPPQVVTVTETVTVQTPMPNADRYRTPDQLTVTAVAYRRALVIGSCLSDVLVMYLGRAFPGIAIDQIVYNHAGTLPEMPPQPIEEYDFQVVMLPLRTAMFESFYFRLGADDVAGHEAAFRQSRERLLQMLDGALGYRARQPFTTFVTNYMVPQQNSMGRLLPRYDLRNPVHFVGELNRVIADEIAPMADVHLLDIDEISANFGRKYIQDDLLWSNSHSSFLSDYDTGFDAQRLEVPPPVSTTHPSRTEEFVVAIGHEVMAMFRTLRQADQVKLVIVDLDDTLWRGVVAEEGVERPMVTEGWPVGFVEALAYVKKRGVLLAIASKNSEARIRELWPHLYGGRLELADFASVQINWEPKADNVERILRETNLLARNTVFIDDNPVERENVRLAFPDIRLLGSNAYELRRVLLWSAETQVAYVTDESARRTEMVQAQVEREQTRGRLSRAEFLDTLGLTIRLHPIRASADHAFARAFELLNKSNQFNTTGRRWTAEACQAALGAGTVFWTFEVEDRFTRYGIVGVAILDGSCVEQFVMSCRVIGLDVEIAVIGSLVRQVGGEATARFEPTDANFLCRDLFPRCGFVEQDGIWHTPPGFALALPPHVRELATGGELAAA